MTFIACFEIAIFFEKLRPILNNLVHRQNIFMTKTLSVQKSEVKKIENVILL